ncbi:MAG: GNAT family N-acetyltransferase [Actinomycetota bacterium]|nr:GNAT family N-acetyltransferase [Actinomycetota bacterium]
MLLSGAPRLLDLLEYRERAGGIEALRRASPWTGVHPSDACPVTTLGSTLEQFLSQRPKGLRRTLRRSDERLATEGHHHDVEVVTGPERLKEVLPDVAAVYDAAERDRPRQHLLARPWGSFTREVLSESARLGRLRLFLGRIDGRPISFDVGFVSADRLELWLGRFDPRYRPISPGHLAMREAVHYAISTSLGEIDMGLGDDRYKRLWCNDDYRTLDVTAASSRRVLLTGRGVLSARRWVRQQAIRATRPRPESGAT